MICPTCHSLLPDLPAVRVGDVWRSHSASGVSDYRVTSVDGERAEGVCLASYRAEDVGKPPHYINVACERTRAWRAWSLVSRAESP